MNHLYTNCSQKTCGSALDMEARGMWTAEGRKDVVGGMRVEESWADHWPVGSHNRSVSEGAGAVTG